MAHDSYDVMANLKRHWWCHAKFSFSCETPFFMSPWEKPLSISFKHLLLLPRVVNKNLCTWVTSLPDIVTLRQSNVDKSWTNSCFRKKFSPSHKIVLLFSALHSLFETISEPDQVTTTHGKPQRQSRAEKVQVWTVWKGFQVQTSSQGKTWSHQAVCFCKVL